MYLLIYYSIFHSLNKYLLNKINYTEFEWNLNSNRNFIQTNIYYNLE